MSNGGINVQETATVGEAVRRHVDDTHDQAARTDGEITTTQSPGLHAHGYRMEFPLAA